jgi:DNA-binding CsgD family transcriptional regulator
MTGTRAHPIDRRRLQGQHRGLKQILAEGGEPDALRRPWRDFSRAMVRQSVNEAMGRLSPRERVVLTMAYFAGFSNLEIADELGMTVRGVQRSLRRGLDRLSDSLERGKRVALGLMAAIAGGRVLRWLSDTAAAPATTHAVAVAVLVAAVVATPADSPATARNAPAVAAPAAIHAQATAPSDAARPAGQNAVPNKAPAVSVPPVSAPAVPLPALPSVPPIPKVKLPGVVQETRA